jgi:hypothetical protein
MGRRTAAMSEHYAKEADTRRRASAAITKLEQAQTKNVQLRNIPRKSARQSVDFIYKNLVGGLGFAEHEANLRIFK